MKASCDKLFGTDLKGKPFVGDLILTVNSQGSSLHGPCVWDIIALSLF